LDGTRRFIIIVGIWIKFGVVTIQEAFIGFGLIEYSRPSLGKTVIKYFWKFENKIS
jgi:hypothetical protein